MNQVEQNVDNNQAELIFEEVGTFCRVGSVSGGILEVDLRCMKQKGTEERFVSVKSIGFDNENNMSQTEMFFLDESQFKKFKDFITKLNWND